MVEVRPETDKKGWPPGHKYGGPCKCKCKNSHEKKLRYVQPPRQPSYAPHKVYKKPDAKMPDSTTYNLSFESFDPKVIRSCKGSPSVAKENLTTAGNFSGLTTHKMSYGAWPGLKRQNLVYPRDHRLVGEGPLSNITTVRHDYTAKPIDTMTKVVPVPNLGFSTQPLEKNTTMGLSYQCPDYNTFEMPLSFKPQIRYLPPASPVDSNTIHKLSFQHWEPSRKEELPWAKKCSYSPPQVPLDGTTIYNGSYIAPGAVVEDAAGHVAGCYCVYQCECGEDCSATNICPAGYDPKRDPPRPPPYIEEEHVV